MTIPEFNIWLKEKTKIIPDAASLPVVFQMMEQIKNRVVNRGLSSNRNRFSAYSDAYLKKKKKRIPAASFKNFFYTGEMWNSFDIQDREDTPGKTVFICKMDEGDRDNTTNQGLLDIHSDYERKELITPTDQEIELARKYYDKKLEELYVS